MIAINRVILVGRVTKDIEVKSNSEMSIAKFSLAVDRTKKGEADFISCVAFGKTAEALAKYTGKGKRLGIEGHIQTGSYTKQDGTKVYTTDVIVEKTEYIEWRDKDDINSGFVEADNLDDLPFG